MLDADRAIMRKARKKAKQQRAEQSEKRGAEARCHAGQGSFEILDNALNGGIGTGAGFCKSPDNLAHGSNHFHQTDKGTDQAEQDQEACEIIEKRAFLADGILHHDEQGSSLGERDRETARFEQFVETHLVDLGQNTRHPEHLARFRGAFQAGGTDEITVPVHFVKIGMGLFQPFKRIDIVE